MTTLAVDIQAALCGRLASPALSGAPPIAYPLVDFTPTPGTAYLEVRPLLQAESERFGLDTANPDINAGVFQVDAVVPADGKGEAPGLALATLVKDRFTKDLRLTASGRTLEIVSNPSIAGALKEGAWVRYPVSIFYRIIA
jgi:hypothetical protein